MGSFCLYQGDLSVDANEKAALWLIRDVFSKLDIPLVIAGKDASPKLLKAQTRGKNTCIISNPSAIEMADLIAKAHINILPSFTHTGIKLKLLNALYNGKHCLVNKATVDGSGFEQLCHIADDAVSLKEIIPQLYQQPFTMQEIAARKMLLDQQFNNEANALKITRSIWEA